MKLLVTGGLGFIGTNFIRNLFSKYGDVGVTNIDKIGVGANLANLKDLEGDSRYRFVRGDIADLELMRRLVVGVDAVVNIAAETHVDRSIADPQSFLQSNTVGTYTILEALRRFNDRARMVQVSSDEVYGDILNGSFGEDARLKPSSPYAASKAAADLFASAYHRTYGLDVIVTRCTNNYGPYQFPEKLIPKAILRAHLDMSIPLYGSGRNVRDWLYVLDHCEALSLVLMGGRRGETYNISAGNELENLGVVKAILEILGKPESLIRFVEDRPGHDIRYSLDSSKIRGELNWRPKHGFEGSLKETVRWYLDNEWWWKPLAAEEVLHSTPWRLR